VDLVDDLSTVQPEAIDAPEPEPVLIQFAEVCGYLDLDEARKTRDQLHQARIVSELVIRTSPDTSSDGPVIEEYWLRADARQIKQVHALLDGSATVSAESDSEAGFKCSNCGRPVREEESFCANCGMRFSG
jgi:hypothetical protein